MVLIPNNPTIFEIDRLFLLENMNNNFYQTSSKLVVREIKYYLIKQ